MAVYIVIGKPPDQDVPALGGTAVALIYRGDHATEQAAVDAAVALLRPGPGAKFWATLQTSFTRYIGAESHSFSSAPG